MHPILLQIGDFYVAWYGLLVAVGLLCGTGVALWLAHRERLDSTIIYDLLLVVIVSLLIGARVFYIITVWDDFVNDPLPHLFSRTGFVFVGGLLGAVGASIAYVRWRGLPIWRLGDLIMPGIPLGHAFGRVGCHLTGCCYGGVCNTNPDMLGIQIKPTFLELSSGEYLLAGGYAWAEHVEAGLIPATATQSLPVWPVQFYSVAGNVAISAILLALYFRRRWVGQIFISYFLLYGIMRYIVEIFRGDGVRGIYDLGFITMSFSQIICAVMFLTAAFLYYLGHKGKLPAQNKQFPETALIQKEDKSINA